MEFENFDIGQNDILQLDAIESVIHNRDRRLSNESDHSIIIQQVRKHKSPIVPESDTKSGDEVTQLSNSG